MWGGITPPTQMTLQMPVRKTGNASNPLINIPCLRLPGSRNIKQPWESDPVTLQVRRAIIPSSHAQTKGRFLMKRDSDPLTNLLHLKFIVFVKRWIQFGAVLWQQTCFPMFYSRAEEVKHQELMLRQQHIKTFSDNILTKLCKPVLAALQLRIITNRSKVSGRATSVSVQVRRQHCYLLA